MDSGRNEELRKTLSDQSCREQLYLEAGLSVVLGIGVYSVWESVPFAATPSHCMGLSPWPDAESPCKMNSKFPVRTLETISGSSLLT